MASSLARTALVLVFLLAGGKASAGEPLQLVVMDVHEGQSVLVSRGARGILIDTGHFGMAAPVLQKLARYRIRQLDYLILSHLHPDHASGFFRIREAFPEAVVIDSGHTDQFTAHLDSVRWVGDALRDLPAGQRRIVSRGDIINWQGARLEVLWPAQPRGDNLNRNSLVLRLQFDGKTALLMGDADHQAEQHLLDRIQPVDVLVAGHHGASDTGSPAFLEAARPKHSVISVNADNLRGYPDPRTVQRLEDASLRVTTTKSAGDVVFSWPAQP